MDMNALQEAISSNGISVTDFCEKIGMSRSGFWRKLQEPERWRVYEVIKVIRVLRLTREESKKIFGI